MSQVAVEIVKNKGIAPGSLSIAIFNPSNARLKTKINPGKNRVTM